MEKKLKFGKIDYRSNETETIEEKSVQNPEFRIDSPGKRITALIAV